MLPEGESKVLEDQNFLGTYELAHGDGRCCGAYHIDAQTADGRLAIQGRRVVRSVEG